MYERLLSFHSCRMIVHVPVMISKPRVRLLALLTGRYDAKASIFRPCERASLQPQPSYPNQSCTSKIIEIRSDGASAPINSQSGPHDVLNLLNSRVQKD
jgi:hypothetical protein